MTFVSAANYASSGKTAIGVVVGNSNRQLRVVGLTSVTGLIWASTMVGDITTIPNFSTPADAQLDMNGKENTEAAYNFTPYNQDDTTAIGWCKLYSTPGTNAGDWYLPSAGELALLATKTSNFYDVTNNTTHVTSINNALSACGVAKLPWNTTTYGYYISSTEKNSSYTFLLVMFKYYPSISDVPKIETTEEEVRPFLRLDF